MPDSDLREAESRWLEKPEPAPGTCEQCCAPATCTILDHLTGLEYLCNECAGIACDECEVFDLADCECEL
jgi:hypothetical protein